MVGGDLSQLLTLATEREAWQFQLDEETKRAEALAQQLKEANALSDDLADAVAAQKRDCTEAVALHADQMAHAIVRIRGDEGEEGQEEEEG